MTFTIAVCTVKTPDNGQRTYPNMWSFIPKIKSRN